MGVIVTAREPLNCHENVIHDARLADRILSPKAAEHEAEHKKIYHGFRFIHFKTP
jgi:hypothetical protein